MIPNPNNDFVPVKNQVVRIIGGCRPFCLNMIVQVTQIYGNKCHVLYVDKQFGITHSGAEFGGLEPVTDEESTQFLEELECVFQNGFRKK